MRITKIRLTTFRYISRSVRDSEGHRHPGPEHEALETLTTVAADGGVEGHAFGGSAAMVRVARRLLVGEDPLARERIWQSLRRHQRLQGEALADSQIAVIDMAL